MEIPDRLLIALIPLAVGSIWLQPEITLISRVIGMFVVSVPMVVLAVFISGAFGGGDMKLMAVCGFLLGWQYTVLAFFISLLSSGLLTLTFIMRRKSIKGVHVAFGPHLCFGIMAALLYGGNIISWYLRIYSL
jgi:leader peptidase (prepilin peptidase)/N-methyltransferase